MTKGFVKRTLFFLLGAIMVVTAVGCGGASDTNPTFDLKP